MKAYIAQSKLEAATAAAATILDEEPTITSATMEALITARVQSQTKSLQTSLNQLKQTVSRSTKPTTAHKKAKNSTRGAATTSPKKKTAPKSPTNGKRGKAAAADNASSKHSGKKRRQPQSGTKKHATNSRNTKTKRTQSSSK